MHIALAMILVVVVRSGYSQSTTQYQPNQPTGHTGSLQSSAETDTAAEQSVDEQQTAARQSTQKQASDAQVITTAKGAEQTPVFLPDGPTEDDFPHLHNLIQVTGRIFSGAEPKGEQAFAELAELGVKVIVSVDGARPKVDLARKYGIRYVHIPMGYDGINTTAAKSFARAADQLQEKTYVHCHHGRHRGPAGAAAICVARGDIDGTQALRILEMAGTSKGYAGLWRAVKGYQRPAENEEMLELVSVAKVGSLAAAMAKIDRASDNLHWCKAANWRSPVDHPDISPPQEALLLKEGFHETIRQLAESNDHDEQFLTWMSESERVAAQLEAVLKAGEMARVDSTFARIQAQCKRCHNVYRD